MNLYVRTMNDVIDHIEENISEQLTLQSVSGRFYLSEFHFSRLFKMITGTSVKQYIIGRKLAMAAEKLKDPQNTVTDVAYDLGFDYPEVFSRNFKKWFGIAPSEYKNGHDKIDPMPKALIIERDIANFGGVLTLKETYAYLDEKNLYGIFIDADENADDFNHKLRFAGESFLTDKRYYGCIKDDFFYTVVNCFGDDSGRYSVFYGGEPINRTQDEKMNIRNVPAGWYACFAYYGEMPDMLKIFNSDFYKWIIIKEIEPCPNGIGMLTIYDRRDMRNLRILVPVKQPKPDG